jgi:hypothetical protein
MSHLPTVAVDGGTGLRSWNNRRLERPDPPRLSHDGPGLATTPAARGAMTEVILAKRLHRLAAVPGVVIGTATPVQYPPAAVPASPDRGSHRAPRRQAPSPAPATARQRQADGKARTNGIGEVREHAADDVAELAFHANEGNIRDGDDQREHS